jgi:hypothetical protein
VWQTVTARNKQNEHMNYENAPTRNKSNNSTTTIMGRANNDEIDTSTTFSTSSRLHIFPLKLHQMLFDTEKDGLESVVSWLPHGQSFRVNDKEQFVNQISKC